MTCPTDYGPYILELCKMAGSAAVLFITTLIAALVAAVVGGYLYYSMTGDNGSRWGRGR